MTDYDNTNRFVLFVNDKKDNDNPEDASPDRSGTLDVNGVQYFIDGWIKQGKKGPFLSGRIKKKQEQGGVSKPAINLDADIPF